MVTLATPPAVNFINTTTTTICSGDTVNFEATAGGGGAPFNYEFYANGGITAVHSYTGTTSTLVTFDPVADAGLVLNNSDYFYVVVTDNSGCQTTSVSRTITVVLPSSHITTSVDFPEDVFCTGEDVDFIATNIGGATYEYEMGSGGRVAVGSSSFTIPYVQLAGTATVAVYVTTGSCVSTDTVFVQENIISSAGTITGTQTICPMTPQRILPVQQELPIRNYILCVGASTIKSKSSNRSMDTNECYFSWIFFQVQSQNQLDSKSHHK